MMGDIQKRLLELIAERGWSIYRLAQEANIHQATVYSWFNNKKYTPSRKSLEAVCAALGISLAEFYSGIDADTLDDDQIRLLELFEKIPVSKRKIVFDFLSVIADEASQK